MVSKIRKLCSSCSYLWNFSTEKEARVWLIFELNARVGQISLRGFSEMVGISSYRWTWFSGKNLLFPLENFFRELFSGVMNMVFRCDEHDEQFGWTWNSNDEHESFLMVEHESFLLMLWTIAFPSQGSPNFLSWGNIRIRTKNHNLSPVNSSLSKEFPKKDARQFKFPMSREEEQSTVQISIYEQRRKLHSANLKKW